MDNGNRTELSQWVEQCTAAAAPPPDWEPNVELARARFQSRLSRRPRARWFWLAGAAAAAVICAALVWDPATRAFAEQLWQRITVGRIEIVRVDFDSLPQEAKSLRAQPIQRPGPPQGAATIEEAARLSGFAPRLPRPGIVPGTPQLSVLGPMSFGTVVKTADLELALRKAGVSDEVVPQLWDGAQLVVQIGSTVNAAWDDVGLMQGLPAVLSTPSGFDLGAFATTVLRATRMDRETAQRFGRRLAKTPALLLGIGAEEAATVREVTLHSGPATLIEDLGDDGKVERVSILWSVPDRVFLLTGTVSAGVATALANSIE